MSFRKKKGSKTARSLLENECLPWHPVKFYERKARQVTEVYNKTRSVYVTGPLCSSSPPSVLLNDSKSETADCTHTHLDAENKSSRR